MWGSKSKNPSHPGGTDFETAAARVTVAEPAPGSGQEVTDNVTEGVAEMIGEAAGDTLEIRPEWAVAIARAPYALVAKFYHPAFAISDEQAEKLGPKLLPLIRKVTDVWIPSWVAGVSNRNPELTDAVLALAVTGYVQWMNVQKVMLAEAEAAENAKRVSGERVTEMPLRSDLAREPEPRIVGERTADGSIVI